MDPSQAPQPPQPEQPAPLQPAAAQPTAAQPAAVQPTVMPQQQPIVTSNPSSTVAPPSNSKLPLIIGAVVVALLLIGGGIALATGGKKESPIAKTQAVTPVAKSPDTTLAPTTKTGAQTIPLTNKVIVDDEMGYTIRATSLGIGNFTIPERYKANNPDTTVVTVHFKNSDTNKFAGSAKSLVLSLVDADGVKYTDTSLNDADLKAAGQNELSTATEANDTVEGEQVYWVPTNKLDKLTLRYKRLAAGVIGSDKTIPAKEFDIVLR